MKNITTFQLVILAVFGIAGLAGVFFLSTYRVESVPEEDKIGNVVIWGTYDGRVMQAWLDELESRDQTLQDVRYQEFSTETFETEVLEALAENRAPDLLLLDNTQVFEQFDRIETITSNTYSQASFRQTFLQMGEVYFVPEGVLGLPLFADPLVLFWNRSLFQSAGEVAPPVTWQDFFRLVPIFTKTEGNLTITSSTLPMGEAVNVNHFKEILATLSFQSGNPLSVLRTTQEGNRYISILTGISGDTGVPSIFPALSFYTEFSNPTSEQYSWNRSLPTSEDYFLAGKSATYIGYASEVRPLQLKNPNLNFDIAEMPQSQNTVDKSVYAKLYGLFIPRGAQNKNGAYKAIFKLTSQQSLESLQDIVKLSVVRRDLAGQSASDDIFTNVFRKQAIYANTFIDPSDRETDAIYASLIESVTSGRRTIDQAVLLSDQEINALFNN